SDPLAPALIWRPARASPLKARQRHQIVVARHGHEHQQEGHAHEMDEAFLTGIDAAAADGLDEHEQDAAAVQGWERDEIEDGQVQAQEGGELQEILRAQLSYFTGY